jgi:antitoxin VapB
MGLNIKNEEVHAAVRELAAVLGVSQTSAVKIAVRARLADLEEGRHHAERTRRIRQAAAELQESFQGVDLRAALDDLYDPTTGLAR